MTETPSLLFVCVGNTCRSVMAEYLAKQRFKSRVLVASAGLRPQRPEDAEDAIDTLREMFRIDAEGHQPRDVRDLDLDAWTLVIAMRKDIKRGLSSLTKRDVEVWNIDDPAGSDPLEYRRCAAAIMRELDRLSAKWP